jgi:RNA polymerase sigma-70 factor (ECF subfamily)
MASALAMKIGLSARRRDAAQAQTEQNAFEVLIRECWDPLWRYAYRMTGNRDDAEDLLGESLLEGFRSFGQFRGEWGASSFCRWMYRVMTTTHIDMTRRAAHRKTESLDAVFDSGQENYAPRDIPDAAADPEAIVLDPIVSEEVQRALDSLPEAYRSVITLVDMEQMDYAEVSRVLRVPIGTVRSRLHRGRLMMRKSLARYVER